MEDIIILGVDVHCLEVIDIIRAMGGYRFIGMISDKDEYPAEFHGYSVLGGKNELARFAGVKRVPIYSWKDRDDKTEWVSVIAPSTFVASSALIGKGCIIYPNCFIGANARLGDGIFMLSGSVVNHDCVIEDRVTITTHVSLAGTVHVKTGTYLGQSCTVRQVLTIGENCLVGMGAVVTRNVDDNTTVIGCPARPYERKKK